MIHILFNIAGSILVIVGLMLLHSFGVLDALWDEALSSGGIANVHTVFRLVSAIVLLPVCGQFEKLSRKLVKDDVRLGENVDHELSLLDEKFFPSPAIALSGAGEAITTMARLARTGVMSAMGVLEQYDAHTIEVINENEEHIDKLADHVDNYLIRLSPHMPSGHGSDMLNYYIQCFGEFERIGDHAVNLTENAQEFLDRSASLSPTAHQELMVLREVLGEILDYTYKAFAATDYEAARHIEPVEEVVDDLVATLRANHIRRVRDGQCTVYAGLTFLDILVNVERIADQCSNVGVFTLSMFDEHIMNNHHDYIQALHQGKDPVFNRAYQEAHDKYFGELKRIERKLDARLSQLQDVRHAPLGEITLIHSPALRLFWIDTALTAPDYSALELSTSRLAAAQAEALVFLGKVGFSGSQEHLNEGSFGQYDGEFLVLDEADRFTGDVIDLPASLCACVRFRGHHAESPAQYRRLMQFIREEGCTAAGFSREITVIDYGFTTDTEKFVTEIMIPLQKV